MKKAFFILLLCLPAMAGFSQKQTPVYAFTNGQWYTGTGFEPANWYSVDGQLTQKQPAQIDSTFDLEGRWIVPPVGDAFCSSVSEHSNPAQQLQAYLGEGIFYLQVLGNTQEGRKRAEGARHNGLPEIAFANGAITCMLGHPFLEYEAPANGVRGAQQRVEKYPELRESRKMQGDGYWFVDSKAGLKTAWEKIMAQRPQVLSIYLLDAENSGGKETKGLSPDMAKAVVKKARRAGIPVFAHVETAADLRLGLKIGVQGFANLPGHLWDGSGDGAKYQLTDADLKALAKKKTAVIPLFSHAQTKNIRPGSPAGQAELFKRLLQHGVNVIAGSDDSQRTLRGEINYWFQVGSVDDARALQILCVNTPQAIFPKRKIGRFAEGYEANFLVLTSNPLDNILKLRAMAFMVYQGKIVPTAPAPGRK